MNPPTALKPGHPERICWGCSLYCRANDLRCGNGSERVQHPFEVFGEDWQGWGLDAPVDASAAPASEPLVSEPPGR